MSRTRSPAAAVLPLALGLAPFLSSCDETEVVNDTPVRATLDDGQVLMGGVTTEVLELVTGFGTVEVPIADVGEVRPVEGGALGGSGNNVSVWLRNGSELRGQWAEPELEMALDIDQRTVTVDLPMENLERFQLQHGDQMPRGEVFRVRTIYGDDFVVDAEATWVSLSNDLGRFEPTLHEIQTLEQLPVSWPESFEQAAFEQAAFDEETPPRWRMALGSGTVLIGALEGTGEDAARLELALPLGPEVVTVPIEAVVSVERQDWGSYDSWWSEEQQAAPAAEQAARDSGEWFDNARQSGFKSAQ